MSKYITEHVIRKTFYITKENEENLKKIADKGHQTEIVNIALKQYLKEKIDEQSRKELIKGFTIIEPVNIGISALEAIHEDRNKSIIK